VSAGQNVDDGCLARGWRVSRHRNRYNRTASARAEETVAGVAEAGEDISLVVELAIERGTEDRDIRVRAVHSLHTGGRGDETEEANPRCAGALERVDGSNGASARREHRIEQEEIALAGVRGNLEVVVHRLERLVIAVQPDVSDARGRNELEDSFHHPEARAEDRDERELLAAHALCSHAFERRVDVDGLKREFTRRLVRHQHRDLVDEFLEDLRRRLPVAQYAKLMLYERVPDDRKAGKCRGGGHGADTTIFALMKEYQAVILKLTQHTREDED